MRLRWRPARGQTRPQQTVFSLGVWAVSGVMLWILSASVLAVAFVPLTIQSLATRADLVVHGTVRGKRCEADSAGRIYTCVEINVAETWKGTLSGTSLTVVHGGGALNGRTSVVSGQVEYEVGEEVVAFLVRNARGQPVTVGLVQGKFHVWKDPRSGTLYAANPFHGVPEGGRAAIKVTDLGQSSSPAPLTLAELKERVLQAQP